MTKEQIEAMIRESAKQRGIDPDIAVKVAASEGLNANPEESFQSQVVNDQGQREQSFGPFQLFMGGGLGNEFQKQTGLDPRNNETIPQQIDFSLDQAIKQGWTPWFGAKRVGIGPRDGLPNATVSSQGSTAQQSAPVLTQLDGETVPQDELTRLASNGIRKADQIPFNQVAGQNPALDQSNGVSEGQVANAASQSSQGQEPEGALSGLLDGTGFGQGEFFGNDGKFANEVLGMGDLTQEQRDNRWLAIGQGLLSGNNMREGLANASQNVLGLRQQEQAQQAQGFNANRANPVLLQDGTQTMGRFNRQTGRWIGPNDQDITSQVVTELNNSDAFGSKGQLTGNQTVKLQSELVRDKNTLETFDRVSTSLNKASYGVEGFADELKRYYDTLLQNDLTPEQIEKAALKGELQVLVGATREQVVGGGVMTEQDAVRVITALGGDLTSLLSNPEIGRELIARQRSKMMEAYNAKFNQYEATRKAFPNLPMTELDRYQPPKTAKQPQDVVDDNNDSSSGDENTEDILKQYGL